MILRNTAVDGWLPALLALGFLASSAIAQDYPGQTPAASNGSGGYHAPAGLRGQPARDASPAPGQPWHRVADRSAAVTGAGGLASLEIRPNEHPLMPAVRWARQELERVQQIPDYSAIMVKRERVGGDLGEEQYMFVKVRHRPLSVYMYFLKPKSLQGQEVIWIEGENDGKMLAHGTGIQKIFGVVKLAPTSPIAMKGNRYPITEIGLLNMVERLIEIGERDVNFGECEVKYIEKAKINDRICTLIHVVHPVPRRNFLFHMARIFVDDELHLPIRYEAWDWPAEPGGPPLLTEQYTYLNLKLNNGFTDADFDIHNPQYQFKRTK